MQEREGGSFKKVPINTSAADLNPLQRPMDEKPVKDDAGTKETNNTETGDETDNLLARKGDGGVDSKLWVSSTLEQSSSLLANSSRLLAESKL